MYNPFPFLAAYLTYVWFYQPALVSTYNAPTKVDKCNHLESAGVPALMSEVPENVDQNSEIPTTLDNIDQLAGNHGGTSVLRINFTRVSFSSL